MPISIAATEKSNLMRLFATRLARLTGMLSDIECIPPQGVSLLRHALFADYTDFRSIVGAEDAELFLHALQECQC